MGPSLECCSHSQSTHLCHLLIHSGPIAENLAWGGSAQYTHECFHAYLKGHSDRLGCMLLDFIFDWPEVCTTGSREYAQFLIFKSSTSSIYMYIHRLYRCVLYGLSVLFHIIQYYVILFTLICNSCFRHSIIHDTFLMRPTEFIILHVLSAV